ncbi:MAG: class I SAM-dependent methyltransferase [Butyrivibrio sp.]|nr:class I SAM-dependent methyltransferase [Butyrivibrio sp.]
MEAYTDFAYVYDTFMDETPYKEWASFLSELICEYGISKPYEGDKSEDPLEQERNLVVELGCGTGSFTEKMAELGYDMVGIDNSFEMLNIAMKKRESSGHDIMYLDQDMRELDLFCTAGTFVSVCDSINYLLENEDVINTFRLVNNYLYPGGLFVFDFNTVHKYRDIIGDTTIAENREDCSFIWDNYYDEQNHINEYDLTIYARSAVNPELFERNIETHLQRGYSLDEMKSFIEEAGMIFIKAIDADTHDIVTEDSERVYVLARESGKNN